MRRMLAGILSLMMAAIITMVPVAAADEPSDIRKVPATFDLVTNNTTGSWDIPLDDAWFAQPAEIYSHDLARGNGNVKIMNNRLRYERILYFYMKIYNIKHFSLTRLL